MQSGEIRFYVFTHIEWCSKSGCGNRSKLNCIFTGWQNKSVITLYYGPRLLLHELNTSTCCPPIRMIMHNEIYFFAEICLCTARWDVYLLYRRVYVENMILVSELYCYYIYLLCQMWVSAVQDNNHDNKKRSANSGFVPDRIEKSISGTMRAERNGEPKHYDVIKWKYFPRYWPFMRRIHRSPVNSSHKGQWRGALMFSLICVWINAWVNSRDAGDLRRYHTHYEVTVMRVLNTMM